MADRSSQLSFFPNYTKPVPSFFGSPKFRAFTVKGLSETDALISPTSILDTKPFSPFGNPFFTYDRNQPISPKTFSDNKHSWENSDAKGIGVALVDTFDSKKIKEHDKPGKGKVLFGAKLGVQIPSLNESSPERTADFEIGTGNSQSLAYQSDNSGIQTEDCPWVATGFISASEMVLSEEYTCVISRGANPRTTHIFDNCVLESYSSLSDEPEEDDSKNFLSFCYSCKKNLEPKNDIYIYRGEKAFCSRECRYQEMLFEGMENS